MFAGKTDRMSARRIVWVLLLLFISLEGICQQTYFMYIQHDQRKPFFVKLDRKIFSSTPAGYLILPKLSAGKIEMAIGFPKSADPDLKFTCSIDRQDVGYLLRSFGEKGFGLFNLQTLDVVMQQAAPDAQDLAKTGDPFAEKLANVVGDPSIVPKKPVVVEPNPQPTPMTPVAETPIVSDTNATLVAKPEGSMEPKPVGDSQETLVVAASSTTATPHIGRMQTELKPDGMSLIYLDSIGTSVDTIDVWIQTEALSLPAQPNPASSNPALESGTGAADSLVVAPTIPSSVTAPAIDSAGGRPFLQMELPSPHARVDSVRSDTVAVLTPAPIDSLVKHVPSATVVAEPTAKAEPPAAAITSVEVTTNPPSETSPVQTNVEGPSNITPTPIEPAKTETEKVAQVDTRSLNSDCKALATDDDFLKLRKKMAGASDEDDMVATARKVMKQKCFTTQQVRNLGVLFLTEPSRYAFFDMAYAFVSDTGNYAALEDQLKDAYFINRFRALIRR